MSLTTHRSEMPWSSNGHRSEPTQGGTDRRGRHRRDRETGNRGLRRPNGALSGPQRCCPLVTSVRHSVKGRPSHRPDDRAPLEMEEPSKSTQLTAGHRAPDGSQTFRAEEDQSTINRKLGPGRSMPFSGPRSMGSNCRSRFASFTASETTTAEVGDALVRRAARLTVGP